ncbi:hypothetical protein [Kutzneria sp. NPDC052558]|uniref:hypothetical protein n=1 Tax=Kutzneria sp. NPDC052558 TaxID=3364121 RepID=UPI0037CBB836
MDPRTLFEAKLTDLRGRRLTAVDYWDVHNYGSVPQQWDHGDWHHAVMGVELTSDAGPVTVTWTNTFFPYGVEVFHDPIAQHLLLGEDGPERIGPAGDTPWSPYLGTPIVGTAFHWDRLELGPSTRADGTVVDSARSVDVPTALRLDFPAGAVWFVAAIPLPHTFIPGDEIMVVFSRDEMRAMGYDDPAFLRS